MFSLPIPSNPRHLSLIRLWFILAISALGFSGLFSLAPVLLRGHFFRQYFDTQHIFDVSLILHVNLSVLVWILTLTTLLWCLFFPSKHLSYGYGLWGVAALGTFFMIISPLFGGEPVKSNYIPVLLNLPFIVGLSMLSVSIVSHSILYLFWRVSNPPFTSGLFVAAITTLLSIACFTIAEQLLSSAPPMDAEVFYNLLFWGGGHVLQFTYITILLIAWLCLASIIGIPSFFSSQHVKLLLLLHLLLVIPTPFFYAWTPDIIKSLSLFTRHMQIVAGIVPGIIGSTIFWSWLISKRSMRITPSTTCIRTSLFFSLFFFAYGGFLGLFIRQMNTIVPAHYHASIVGGLTMALMGIAYHILPKLGYRTPHTVMASIQPYLYSIGHLLHITGLAVMGGYGALRKTVADTGHIDTLIGKWMFFSGSPLALLGGLLFIVVVLLAMKKPASDILPDQSVTKSAQ